MLAAEVLAAFFSVGNEVLSQSCQKLSTSGRQWCVFDTRHPLAFLSAWPAGVSGCWCVRMLPLDCASALG